jgi:molecular chaperone IbpA
MGSTQLCPAMVAGNWSTLLERIRPMRTFDFAPLLRSSIGYENINRLLDYATRADGSDTAYPPYNIEKLSDDAYRVSVAAAGFSREEIDITVQENTLIITGAVQTDASAKPDERTFLHRGVAKRAFERRFQLADTIKVTGASYVNGLLNVDLVREVPEHKKPRKIEIVDTTSPIIEHQKLAA